MTSIFDVSKYILEHFYTDFSREGIENFMKHFS